MKAINGHMYTAPALLFVDAKVLILAGKHSNILCLHLIDGAHIKEGFYS